MKKSRSIVGIAVVVSSVVLIGTSVMAHRAIEQFSATSDALVRAKALELEVDPLRIAQVLGNLLTNAAKYTAPEGQIRLSAERSNGEVLVRVVDNGIGLALSKGLVDLHRGTLEAKSAGLGQGSEFIMRLPLQGNGQGVT